jgi:hypothetical protein
VYVERPEQLSTESVGVFVALSKRTDIAPGPGGSRITPIKPSPDLDALVGKSGGYRAMFVALYPSAQIVAHEDPPIAATRVHVPLMSNTGCWVFHDGTWQQLRVGQAYQMDPERVHGAVNWGDVLRLHLVVDIE